MKYRGLEVGGRVEGVWKGGKEFRISADAREGSEQEIM